MALKQQEHHHWIQVKECHYICFWSVCVSVFMFVMHINAIVTFLITPTELEQSKCDLCLARDREIHTYTLGSTSSQPNEYQRICLKSFNIFPVYKRNCVTLNQIIAWTLLCLRCVGFWIQVSYLQYISNVVIKFTLKTKTCL